jgi:hypothetical protein
LRRLEDAHEQGNHVLAVIQGSSVNSDGRSNGITAPSQVSRWGKERGGEGRGRKRGDEVR